MNDVVARHDEEDRQLITLTQRKFESNCKPPRCTEKVNNNHFKIILDIAERNGVIGAWEQQEKAEPLHLPHACLSRWHDHYCDGVSWLGVALCPAAVSTIR
jgi:hypothetical protein